MTIRLKLEIEKPYYNLTDKEIGEYLKELKQTRAKIEKEDFTFEQAGLCNSEQRKDVLSKIDEQIKLCEHYFKTKKRKDLFKWIFQEKAKPNNWNEERDIYSFSNGLLKGVIEIFKREKSTEIIYRIKNDSNLYLYFYDKDTQKNLRSEDSIKTYIEETKKYLEAELGKVEYDKREKVFYDFVLNRGENKNDI